MVVDLLGGTLEVTPYDEITPTIEIKRSAIMGVLAEGMLCGA
jgi:hypothetical protein